MADETETIDDEELDDLDEDLATVDADLDDADDTEGEAGEDEDFYDDATCAERVLDVCIRAIVDDEDSVEIEPEESGNRLTLHVSVAQADMGKIIGKRGRVATALRTLVKAAGARDGYSTTVEIDD